MGTFLFPLPHRLTTEPVTFKAGVGMYGRFNRRPAIRNIVGITNAVRVYAWVVHVRCASHLACRFSNFFISTSKKFNVKCGESEHDTCRTGVGRCCYIFNIFWMKMAAFINLPFQFIYCFKVYFKIVCISICSYSVAYVTSWRSFDPNEDWCILNLFEEDRGPIWLP